MGSQEIMRKALSKSGLTIQGSLGEWGKQSGICETGAKADAQDLSLSPQSGGEKPEVAKRYLSSVAMPTPKLSLGIGSGWWIIQFHIHPLPVGELRPKAYSFLHSSGTCKNCHQKMYLWGNRDGKNGGKGQWLPLGSYLPLTWRNAFILFSRAVIISPQTHGNRYREEFSEVFEIPGCVLRAIEDFCLFKPLWQCFADCNSRPPASESQGSLSNMRFPGLLPRLAESELLGMEPRNLHFCRVPPLQIKVGELLP